MPRGRAVLVVSLLVTALALGGCANGPGPATSVPTPVATDVPAPPAIAGVTPPAQARVDGEEAAIEVEPATQRALEDAQIEVRTEEPTLGQLPGWADGQDTVHLPITDGQVLLAPPPRGRVQTSGSLMLSRRGGTVDLADLVVDLDAARVTGSVDGRPATVFDLDLSRARVEDLPSLPATVVDVSATMTDDVRGVIRDRLGVDLPPPLTRADLELRLRPVTG